MEDMIMNKKAKTFCGSVLAVISVVLFGCVNPYEEKSGDTRLKSLSVTSGGAELIEDFDADTLVYTAVVPYMETAAISAEAASGAAWLGYSANVTDGVITLHEGANTVSVTVNAEDGDTRKYTVTITVAAPVVEPPKEYARLEITTQPTKTAYLIGETVDLSGLALTKVFSNGEEEAVASDAYTAEWSTWTAGTFPVTVTVDGKNAAFDITVSGTLVDTGLPVVYIDTENSAAITSKEDYVSGTMTIWQEGSKIHENTMRIRGRGNATWGYPKKPYKIKLDSKANFFGMGNDKDWVLLANYCDKTLMRTGIAFHLSKLMGFPWTPDAQFVELVVNGSYLGNYQLVEGIKQDEQRVDVDEDEGFIIERDGYYLQEPRYFVTDAGYGYSFKQPDTDDLTDAQWDFIKDYMNEFEAVLASDEFDDLTNGYQKYIDLESFARWFLFQNVIANLDTNPYLTKNDNTTGSKVCMGPVWDFEWSLGIGWYAGARPRPAGYWVQNGWYFAKLLESPAFTGKVKELWNTYKFQMTVGGLAYFVAAKAEIADSQSLNFRRWDILNTRVSVGGIPLGSFDAEVECDRQFFINHINWLDTAISGL
jgi:hypothetical protein